MQDGIKNLMSSRNFQWVNFFELKIRDNFCDEAKSLEGVQKGELSNLETSKGGDHPRLNGELIDLFSDDLGPNTRGDWSRISGGK